MKKLKYFIILFFGLPFVMDLLLSIPALHGASTLLAVVFAGLVLVLFFLFVGWVASRASSGGPAKKMNYLQNNNQDSSSKNGAKDYNWWYDRHSRPDRW